MSCLPMGAVEINPPPPPPPKRKPGITTQQRGERGGVQESREQREG